MRIPQSGFRRHVIPQSLASMGIELFSAVLVLALLAAQTAPSFAQNAQPQAAYPANAAAPSAAALQGQNPAAAPNAAPAAWTVPAVPPDSLKILMGDSLNRIVTVCGKITNKIPASSERAPHKWYITDGQGVALLVVFPSLYKDLTNPDVQFPIGGLIQVRGTVKEHQGVLQVVPSTALDLSAAAPQTPQGVWGAQNSTAQAAQAIALHLQVPGAIPPGKIDKTLLNKELTVAGRVSAFRASWSETAPSILTLEGEGGSVDVVFWSNVDKALAAQKTALTAMGAAVAAKGTLKEYRGKMQVNVGNAEDMKLIGVSAAPANSSAIPANSSAAPAGANPQAGAANLQAPGIAQQASSAANSAVTANSAAKAPAAAGNAASNETPEPITPSKISKSHVGKLVVVRGKVQSIQASTGERVPTRIQLADDNGTIQVVFWKDAESEFSGAKAPQEGQPWGVIGQVGEHQGRLQVRAKQIAP